MKFDSEVKNFRIDDEHQSYVLKFKASIIKTRDGMLGSNSKNCKINNLILTNREIDYIKKIYSQNENLYIRFRDTDFLKKYFLSRSEKGGAKIIEGIIKKHGS